MNANGAYPQINAALRNRINDWNRRHARAREALLKCLDPADLIKVYSVRESAAGIWTRLYEEYGQVLDLEYMRADNEYHLLRKAPETTMDDHINQFTKLRQKLEYHKPPNAQANTDGMANLAFLSSLSGLKEWSLFGLAKGANINNMTSAALFAEVKAYDATLNPPKTSTETTSDQAKALYSNIHDQRGGSNRGNHRGGGSNRGGSHGGSRAVVLAKEAKEEAILMVAKVARTTSIQTSIAQYMADKDMMQSTVAKLQAKEKKKKAAMDLESQIGHINQALNVTQCP